MGVVHHRSPIFPPFEVIRGEREAARAEREAASATAKAEREAAAAEQRRLMEEVFELRLQLALGARQSRSAVQSSAGVRGGCTTNLSSTSVEPARSFNSGNERTGSHLTPRALHTPRAQEAVRGAVIVELGRFKRVTPMSHRSKMRPYSMARRPSSPNGSVASCA